MYREPLHVEDQPSSLQFLGLIYWVYRSPLGGPGLLPHQRYVLDRLLLDRVHCSINDFVLDLWAEFNEICAIASYSYDKASVFLRILLRSFQGLRRYDIELNMVNPQIDERSQQCCEPPQAFFVAEALWVEFHV